MRDAADALEAEPRVRLDVRAVLARAASGQSCVVEGPPGAGKSQTIVNAIVQALNAGQRVWVVAEKRAAVDVVAQRLAALGLGKVSTRGFVRAGEESRMVGGYVDRFRIRTPSVEQLVGLLSGGNQQKVVLAKWLAAGPRVLIVDEPTRGVDVGAREELFRVVGGLVEAGAAVLLISSDLEEVLRLSHRVALMRDGRLLEVRPAEGLSAEAVMARLTGAAAL